MIKYYISNLEGLGVGASAYFAYAGVGGGSVILAHSLLFFDSPNLSFLVGNYSADQSH